MAKACIKHSEATHPGLKRKRSITEREFDLSEYQDGNGDAETDWAKRYWTFLGCPTETWSEHSQERQAHNDAIIIAVDGACRDNGQPGARSGAGVFFHRNNWRWNKAVALEDEYNTSQRAELFACALALKSAKAIRDSNLPGILALKKCPGPSRRLRRVIIKAHSEYLVKSMTTWIEKWRGNGFHNYRGLPVTNADMFQHIDAAVFELNSVDVEV